MLNLPNILASVRILLAPLLLFLLLALKNETNEINISWLNYLCALIFALACMTDFFDGYIAR